MSRNLSVSVKATGRDDDFPGSFVSIGSTESVDRDGEVVKAGAFNPLPATIPIHVDHVMSVEGLVGSGRPYYEGGVLKIAGTYAGTPRAQIIRQLVREGHVSTMSIAFMSAEYAPQPPGQQPTIVKGELLAVDFVSIPSNRDARVLVARSFTDAHGSTVSEAKVRAQLALAEAELFLSDDIDQAFKMSSTARARRIVAETEALLRSTKGT